MPVSTTPAPARTQAAPHTVTGRRYSPTTVRRLGVGLAAGTVSWAVANLVFGFTPDSELGWKVTDLTGLAFQAGVMGLLHVQMATRATGVRSISRRLLQVERVLLSIAMVWSLLHALLPDQRDAVWLGVLDAFWPLSMLGMFLIGIKVAIAGRWRGAARGWSFLAETWAPVSVPTFVLLGSGVADVVGSVHLLLGYTVLGLILAARPDLVEDRG